MIIELEDRVLIEAEVANYQVASPSEKVQKTIDSVRPLLLKVVQPVLSAWNDLAKSATSDKAEIELGFGIEASGNFFVASSKGNANLKVKLTVARTPAA
jgi:Trypsin-co-occurring domain 1